LVVNRQNVDVVILIPRFETNTFQNENNFSKWKPFFILLEKNKWNTNYQNQHGRGFYRQIEDAVSMGILFEV
jgi:hypothetical protein